MKKLCTLFATVTMMAVMTAQITVTNATFPVVGDTLRTATDLNPAPNDGYLTPPGGPQNWDFSSLAVSSRQEAIYRPASEGMAAASFPNATLFTTSGQIETYYAGSSTSFDNHGFSAPELTGGLPVDALIKYVPPLTERHAPMNFFDIHQYSSNAIFAVSLDMIPSEILDSFGIPTSLADSIRIRLTTQALDVVDAHGVLTIPGGMYDVLRKKRTEYRQGAIDVHTAFGWIDVTTFVQGTIPGIGVDTVIAINFYSNTEKEIIASVTMDASGAIQQVTYKDNGVMSGTEGDRLTDTQQVIISPNPVSTLAQIHLKNLPTGVYSLQLFNAAGNLILTKQIPHTDDTISFEGFENGLYLYRLSDERNRPIVSGKLQVQNH